MPSHIPKTGSCLTYLQYYILTKEPLPMDVDFLVQDTYSVTRPQWKVATDLQEATILFSEAVAQNYKTQDAGKPMEPEEDDAESSSSDEGLEEDAIPEVDEEQESSDEADVSYYHLDWVIYTRANDETGIRSKRGAKRRQRIRR